MIEWEYEVKGDRFWRLRRSTLLFQIGCLLDGLSILLFFANLAFWRNDWLAFPQWALLLAGLGFGLRARLVRRGVKGSRA